MFLAVSSIVMIGCQGCAPVPANGQPSAASSYQITSTDEDRTEVLIDARSSFSLSQGQTANSPQISIKPILGELQPGPVNIAVSSQPSPTSLRLSNSAAIVDFQRRRNAANISNPVRPVRDFDAELAFSATDRQTGLGFDVGLVPRVSLKEDGDFQQRSFGGEVRIGQNFDQRGENVEAKSWYLFAGADGEALVYEPDGDRSFTNRMALRDQVTVGDMQAGVSFTRGNGQVSLSYIRREVEYRERNVVDGREKEDFAGISFTVRR